MEIKIPDLDPETFEPSQKTDLWVAHKVMRWPVIAEQDPFQRFLSNGGVIVNDRPQIFRFGTIPDAWMPSTRIEDAFVILRKMKYLGWDYKILGDHDENKTIVILRKKFGEFNNSYLRHASAETESLAICRAAGLAVIGDTNEH